MDAPFFRNWTDQMRKGILELTILNDIRHRGMYGYEIQKKPCKSHGLLLGDGVIYRMFKKFVRHRLVSSTEVKSPDGPKRRYYQLAESGQEALVQMNAYWQALKGQADAVARDERTSRPPASSR